jgi:hypothetical protein
VDPVVARAEQSIRHIWPDLQRGEIGHRHIFHDGLGTTTAKLHLSISWRARKNKDRTKCDIARLHKH